MLAQELGVFNKHGLLARNRANNRRYAGIIAITNPDGFTLFKINAVKVFNKAGSSIDKTVNNALKFTNLSMLTDARLMKGDMAALLRIVLEAENDADEILSAMMDMNLPMIDSSFVTKHAQ